MVAADSSTIQQSIELIRGLKLREVVCATGTGEDSWDVDRNLRTYVLHQNTLRINNRSHGRFAPVSGAAKHDRTMTRW